MLSDLPGFSTLYVFTHKIDRAIRRAFKIDHFELNDGIIVHRHGLLSRTLIPVESIESWSAYPEMVFDVVCVRQKDGAERLLLDSDGELQDILRRTLRKETAASRPPMKRRLSIPELVVVVELDQSPIRMALTPHTKLVLSSEDAHSSVRAS